MPGRRWTWPPPLAVPPPPAVPPVLGFPACALCPQTRAAAHLLPSARPNPFADGQPCLRAPQGPPFPEPCSSQEKAGARLATAPRAGQLSAWTRPGGATWGGWRTGGPCQALVCFHCTCLAQTQAHSPLHIWMSGSTCETGVPFQRRCTHGPPKCRENSSLLD